MTAEEFYKFCKNYPVFDWHLPLIQGKTFTEFWENTEYGDVMYGLKGKLWDFTPEQKISFAAKMKVINVPYLKQTKPLNDAYLGGRMADLVYWTQRQPIDAAYFAKIANLLREIVGIPTIKEAA
jgi:hypothetical protein